MKHAAGDLAGEAVLRAWLQICDQGRTRFMFGVMMLDALPVDRKPPTRSAVASAPVGLRRPAPDHARLAPAAAHVQSAACSGTAPSRQRGRRGRRSRLASCPTNHRSIFCRASASSTEGRPAWQDAVCDGIAWPIDPVSAAASGRTDIPTPSRHRDQLPAASPSARAVSSEISICSISVTAAVDAACYVEARGKAESDIAPVPFRRGGCDNRNANVGRDVEQPGATLARRQPVGKLAAVADMCQVDRRPRPLPVPPAAGGVPLDQFQYRRQFRCVRLRASRAAVAVADGYNRFVTRMLAADEGEVGRNEGRPTTESIFCRKPIERRRYVTWRRPPVEISILTVPSNPLTKLSRA